MLVTIAVVWIVRSGLARIPSRVAGGRRQRGSGWISG
jgi:hypothetical protein